MAIHAWDAYLSDEERSVLAKWPLHRIGFGKSSALILVDLYRAVFGAKPEPLKEAVKTWPYSCGLAGWNSIPHISRLLAASRQARIPIIHLTGLYPEDSGIAEWQNRKAGASDKKLDLRNPNKSRYEIISELRPRRHESFMRKSAPSAFWGTPLVAHLNSLAVDTVIVAGETTSGCVRATVVDARTYSYRVIVPEECVFDRIEASHAMSLFDMNQKYADVLPVSEVLRFLGSSGKNAVRRN